MQPGIQFNAMTRIALVIAVVFIATEWNFQKAKFQKEKKKVNTMTFSRL